MRRAILLSAAMGAALVLASGAALAYTLIEKVADPGTIGANGRIWSIVADQTRNTVYLGGAFTQVTDTDGKIYQRNNLAAIDATTGRLLQNWNPNATRDSSDTSMVRAMALSSDRTSLFAGGTFSTMSGQPHSRLAAIDTTTGQATSWNPGKITGSVYALAASASKLYAGGDITSVAGQPRERLAALSTSTGALDPTWKPRAHRLDGNSSIVRALNLSEDGSLVYVGGFFNHISDDISDVRTGKLAAINATTGALNTTFRPNQDDVVLCMDVDVPGGNVYVGTDDPLEGIESFNGTTGQLRWSVPGGHPDPRSGAVQAITVWGDTVYAGGHGTLIGGLIRKRLYAADAATGKILDWAPVIPGGEGSLGVWSLEVDAGRGRLYAGGDFTQVTGVPHQRFAQFSD
jgi:trimeric autotransporter adhesin